MEKNNIQNIKGDFYKSEGEWEANHPVEKKAGNVWVSNRRKTE